MKELSHEIMDFVSFIIHDFEDFLCFSNSSAVLIQTEHSSMLHRHNESAVKIKLVLTMLKLEAKYLIRTITLQSRVCSKQSSR